MKLKKKLTRILFITFITLSLSSMTYGNSPHNNENNICTSLSDIDTFKKTTEIKGFLKLKEDYEQELTHFEVVGREKSEEEMHRSQQIKKIIFYLNKIVQVSSGNKITFP